MKTSVEARVERAQRGVLQWVPSQDCHQGTTLFRSAQVRAYDDRAWCRNVGTPYKRAYALSSYALTYVALITCSFL